MCRERPNPEATIVRPPAGQGEDCELHPLNLPTFQSANLPMVRQKNARMPNTSLRGAAAADVARPKNGELITPLKFWAFTRFSTLLARAKISKRNKPSGVIAAAAAATVPAAPPPPRCAFKRARCPTDRYQMRPMSTFAVGSPRPALRADARRPLVRLPVTILVEARGDVEARRRLRAYVHVHPEARLDVGVHRREQPVAHILARRPPFLRQIETIRRQRQRSIGLVPTPLRACNRRSR